MLLIDTPITQASTQLDYPAQNDELNRLLSAAVVSKSFRNMLLANPEIALSSGYQGEKFNLNREDQNWLYSIRPESLVDLAASMVAYQESRSEQQVPIPVKPARQYVRVN